MVHPETYEDVVRGHQGLILACGQNVFSNYLDRTSDDAFIEIDNQRYYVTGDLGILDESNALVITGRMKRFVKIGGEMISLPAMETVIRNRLPQNEGEITSALTYIEDPGQRPLICLFTAGGLRTDVGTVNGFLRNAGLSNLTRVRKVMHIDEMPLLGTGKTNYRELTDLLRISCGSGLNVS